jgi:hypothetical protein
MTHLQRLAFALLALVLVALGLPASALRGEPVSTATQVPRISPVMQAAVSAAIGRDDASYHAARAGGTWQTRSPGHEMTTTFDAKRVLVATADVEWGIRLRAFGRGDALVPAGTVRPESSANRVEYRRGGVTEWYINGPAGLEQGFTVRQRPAGPAGEPLRFEMTTSGGLRSELDADRLGVTLHDASGAARLRYSGLMAEDANRRPLPATLSVEGSAIVVTVDDRGARYPIVVDPLVQAAKLVAGDGVANDRFGFSVAISGDTLVAGARHGDSFRGAAYVFTRTGTAWSEQAKLTAGDAVENGEFGISVDISGDTIVVGADSGDSSPGAAYVFVRSGATWSERAKLTASDGAADELFGSSVAIDGDTAVVGAPHHAPGGAAYVFTRGADVWTGRRS